MRSGAGLNGDNLRISTSYLRISDHCRVTVRIRVWIGLGLGLGLGLCIVIQAAGESDKIRINHVIKTDQWRSAPQIRPAPYFDVTFP